MKKLLGVLFVCTVVVSLIRVAIAMPVEVIVQEHNSEFPRVSSPCLACLPNGSMLAVFSNATSGGIWGKLSNDGGLSWGDRVSIQNSTVDYQAYSGSLLVDGDRVFLFYVHWVAFDDDYKNCTVWKLESFDNGQTWANNVRIDLGNHDYTLTSYSSIRMRNGTLIVPISWFSSRDYYFRWRSGLLRSDDGGESWFEGGYIPDWQLSVEGLDEPTMVELSNSSLYAVMRTATSMIDGANNARHVYSVSNDYGLTWNSCWKIEVMVAKGTTPAVFRYSWNPSILLAAWVNSTVASTWGRRPLALVLSKDESNSWSGFTVLDPAIGQSVNEPIFASFNGTVDLGYRRMTNILTFDDDSVTLKFTLNDLNSSDFNNDGRIDTFDAETLTTAFDSTHSSAHWNPYADLNNDGIVDIYDAILLSRAYQG